MAYRTTKGKRVFFINWEVLDDYAADIGPQALAVYVYLARRVNERQECWPGQKHIGKTLGMSDRQVRREVAKLLELGLVEVQKRPGGTTRQYRLMAPWEDGAERTDSPPDRTHSPTSGRTTTDSQSAPPDSQSYPERTHSPTEVDTVEVSSSEINSEGAAPLAAHRENFVIPEGPMSAKWGSPCEQSSLNEREDTPPPNLTIPEFLRRTA